MKENYRARKKKGKEESENILRYAGRSRPNVCEKRKKRENPAVGGGKLKGKTGEGKTLSALKGCGSASLGGPSGASRVSCGDRGLLHGGGGQCAGKLSKVGRWEGTLSEMRGKEKVRGEIANGGGGGGRPHIRNHQNKMAGGCRWEGRQKTSGKGKDQAKG